ncbi:putative RNA-directed DNA polymerase [Helianthus annuus]|nr:putative RNA-directed DNA polymerase [Helianthus annuus]
MDNKLHPAVTVSNIKTAIPVTLKIENGHWSTWSELFKFHCKAFQVYDHLLPRPPPAATSSTDKDKAPANSSTTTEVWERLDSIVLQWIHGTISQDLVHTIIKPGTTAHQAWTTLENLFQDNKSARALHLRYRFTNTRLENFANVSAYCQELKVLSDQLANVGHPVDSDALVLQLIVGLTEQYEGIGIVLQSQDPLLQFATARSKHCLIESRKQEQALHAAKTAGTTLTTSTRPSSAHQASEPTYNKGRGRDGRSRDRGRGRSRHSWGRGQLNYNPWPTSPHSYWPPAYGPWPNPPNQPPSQAHWAPPPCPCPTSNPRPAHNSSGAGILGSAPSQAHHAAYIPTDIDQALQAMSLTPPHEPTGYMDTGATGLQEPDPYPPVQQQR